MGLKVLTSFETPNGFAVSNLYVAIDHVSLTTLGASTTVRVVFAPFLSREKRIARASPLQVPGLSTSVSFTAPLADCIRFEVLYAYIARELASKGFTTEPVAEDGQTLLTYVIPDVPEVSPQSSE